MLLENGHSVRIFCNHASVGDWLHDEAEVVELPKNPIAAYQQITELYQERPPDIAHSHDNLGYLAELTSVPHVTTSHSNWPRSWFLSRDHFLAGVVQEIPYDLLLRLSDAAVAVSEYSQRQLASRYNSSEVVYNGVQVPEDVSYSSDQSFLFVGTVDNRKAKYLPQIWEHIESQSDATLDVVGNPSSERIVEALRLFESVTVHGKVDKIEPFYTDSSVLLFPSRAEACPLTVLEAQAHGLPVVAFDVCSHSELIRDRTGDVVSPYDIDSFATAAIHQLLDYNQDVFELCRENIKDKFNVGYMFQEYLELYHALTNR
jgi:glycosyltransferase involved in cell wall biosynthesis